MGLVGVVIVLVAFLVFHWTPGGQHLDYLAFEGRKATQLAVRRALTWMIRWLTPPGVVLGGVTILWSEGRRGRFARGTICVTSVITVLGLARLLKATLPMRDLARIGHPGWFGTFPSGHTAAVMALALVWIYVGSLYRRVEFMALVTILMAAWITAMLGSGWHRFSDVVGGLGVALSGVCLFTAICEVVWPRQLPCSDTAPRLRVRASILLGALTVMGSAGFVLLIRNRVTDPRHSLVHYVVTVVVANALATALLFGYSKTVGRWSVSREEE